jgi:Bacterial capsule synthesis protein PGA_cap
MNAGRWRLFGILIVALVASCDGMETDPPNGSVVLLFGGDVMLGRGVASIVEHDPHGLFAEVESVLGSADLALANLESPLTNAAQWTDRPYDLRASPLATELLALAGFDVLALANNHIGDAGPAGVMDSITRLREEGVATVGAGNSREALRPEVRDINGVRVALLAFDCSGMGLLAGEEAGVAAWGEDAKSAVADAAAVADVVAVGLHGGAAYVDRDPVLERASREAVKLGADIVWGYGAHIQLPVSVVDTSVVARGLGNLLFDQSYPGTKQGTLLEVLADTRGVVAWRTGVTDHSSGRVQFVDWDLPGTDAVLLDSDWWNLMPRIPVVPGDPIALDEFPFGDVVAAAIGDVDRDDAGEVVVSFRRPFQETLLNTSSPQRWQDSDGRSAHIGVFTAVGLSPEWIAGTLARPVASVSVCDGGLAVGYDSLDDDTIVAVGGWVWNGFGFTGGADLAGAGIVGCVDINRDGATEPAITSRGFRH